MAIGTLFGGGSESSGLYGIATGSAVNPTVVNKTYFEWFIFTTSAGAPATPTGGSWNFTSNIGTAPAGWFNYISGVPLNNLWFSIAFVDSRNPLVIVWSTPGLISSQSVYATAYADVFTGNGSTVAWTLSNDPVVVNNTDVSINGVTQVPTTDYTISGTTLTTTTAAPLNAIILVKYRQALPLSYYGAASNVQFTPYGWIAATNVQDAFEEVVDDLGASSGSSLVGFLQSGTGAVATTVQAKLRESVSVLDFGAVGDGVTDDTVAIQAAINHILTSSTQKSLYIPTGVYKLTDTLSARNLASFNGGNYMIYGDGISSVLYQTGAGKNVLTIGSYSTGAVTTDLQEGVTLSSFSMVGTTGTSKGLYVNSVARSFFDNLYIVADDYALFLEGCLINTWDGIKLSYANFNENPIAGIAIPTTRNYGLYVSPSNQGYTTNVWNSLVIEGNSVYGGYVDGGSTNTYNNLVCEGHTGAGFFSQSEWDVFNGIYVEAITGTALTLQNTQKISIISLFTNTESVVLSNCIATIINSRADWTVGISPGGITFINSDGTLTYTAGSTSGTDLRLINSSLFDLTHKVQLGSGFGMAGGTTSAFSSVAPRAIVDRISYVQTPQVLASYGDKVWFSQGNVAGNLGAKPGGYAGLIVSNRVETTAASIVAPAAAAVVVASATGMLVGDVLAVNVTSNTYEFSSISSIVGTTVNLTGTIPTGAASSSAVFAIRWDLFGETAGFDALNSASATPTVASGGRNFTLADAGFSITNFTDALIGQEIRLFPNVAGTIVNGAPVQLAGGANFVMAAGDSLTLIKKPDGVWYEVCRSVN